MTDPPATPRVCSACGGRDGDCPWCEAGFQSQRQAVLYARYKIRERKLSDTSALAEELLLAVLARLDAAGEDELVGRGLRLHALWADARRSDRAELARLMSAFLETALDRLGEESRPTDPGPRLVPDGTIEARLVPGTLPDSDWSDK